MSAGFMDNDRVGDRGGKGAGSDILDGGEGAAAVASIEAALPFSEASSAWPSFRILALGYRVSKTVKCSTRSEEHTSELQSRLHLVCRLLLEKKKKNTHTDTGQTHAAPLHKKRDRRA